MFILFLDISFTGLFLIFFLEITVSFKEPFLLETHIQKCVEASSCFVDLSFTMIARMGHNSGVKFYIEIHIGESIKYLLKIKFGYLQFKICN